MERLLDHYMRDQEKYTEEQIEAFYTSFKANMKEYEGINAHTLDVLYGIIDF